jgi:purine-binding chemotaxis protein CheW
VPSDEPAWNAAEYLQTLSTQHSPLERNEMSNTHDAMRVLVFRMDDHEYAVDVAQVSEIVQPARIAHMDGAPPHVLGFFERRRHNVPVVDLRRRLGLAQGPATPHTCVIVARMEAGLVGLLVDGVSELLRVRASDFQAPSPYVVPVDRVYLRGAAMLEERLLVMLDFERLLTIDEQKALGGSFGEQE